MEAGFIALAIAFVGQAAAVWAKLASLQKSVDSHSCPFGGCPLFVKAKREASNE